MGLEAAKKALGTVFLHKDQRLSDLLNDEKFIILKDVKVLPLNSNSQDGSYKKYLTINKDFIVSSWEEE